MITAISAVHTAGINWASVVTIVGSLVVIMSTVFGGLATGLARYVTGKITNAIDDFRVDVICKMDERVTRLETLADNPPKLWKRNLNMTRIMRDAVNYLYIPTDTAIVAAYVDGLYAVNESEYRARFPRAARIHIDVTGNHPQLASVRDWETGDKSGSLEQWVIDRKEYGPAIVYCNRSTIPEVRQLTGTQKLGVDYWLWISTLDGTEYKGGTDGVTAADVVACQTRTVWSGATQLYDESVVYSATWPSKL